ncbi:MAG: terminase family protein [Planctomycetes bacterium]|nr:terminase family protein [Planctomycetota bacterium]
MAIATVARRLSPAAFFRDMGYQPHPGQWAIHSSTASRRIVACGVRWGKTLCAAMEGLCAAMQPKERSIGWVVAPTYDLADKVYRELIVLAAEHLRHRIIALKESERRLVLRNLAGGASEIRGKSADNPVSLLGEGLDWVIIDEAARLKPTIWESHLSQRLLDRHGWALMISTPKGKGWYYDLFRRGQGVDPDYASWNHPSWTNPYVSAELIEQERERLPERVFKQEYGGEFLEGAGAVFRNIRDCATGAWQPPQPKEYYYAGLDLAKIEDFTVLVVLNQNREVVFVDRFHRLDWSVQVNRIRAATDRYHRARVLVDSTGAGEPVFESLRRAGCNAVAYPFTARTKAAVIDNLSLMFEQGLITLPRADLWPDGIDELESFEFSVTDAGNVKTGAPSGVHDDCVIALALAAWQVRPSRPVPMVYV